MKRFLTILLLCALTLICPVLGTGTAQYDLLPADLPALLPAAKEADDPAEEGEIDVAAENMPFWEPAVDVPADSNQAAPELPAAKDGRYATMGDLYQAWGGYAGYPDYICGVWSTDGGMSNMTVAVTKDEAGERGKEEILSLLQNPDTVTFTYQGYSYRELLEVNEAIVARMLAGDTTIISCGIHEMDNQVQVTLLETAEDAEAVAVELLEQYGVRVAVSTGDMLLEMTKDRGGAHPDSGGLTLLLAALLLGVGAFAARRPARLTTSGQVVSGERRTRGQTERLVRECTETPPNRVEEAIRKQL